MLTSTFCHIPGIGQNTERKLWAAGVTSWHSAWPHDASIRLSRPLVESWGRHIQDSIHHHSDRNPHYFAEHLPANQHWRLYGEFQDACAFLDIETTGLSSAAEITTITLYDGRTIRSYVNGHNLDDFLKDV